MHGERVGNDSPYMDERTTNVPKPRPKPQRLGVHGLAQLVQSEMGLAVASERLEELLASMQAHVAARGFPEDWSKIEVPRLLHGWVCCYATGDLGPMLELWVDLLLWMRELSFVPEPISALYLRDTREWLIEQRSLAKVYEQLWRRL